MMTEMFRGGIFLVAACLTITGCGRGGAVEQPVLAGIRAKAVERCEMTAGSSPAVSVLAARGVDIEGVCGCAVDHIMAGKSPMQLMSLTKSSPELREAVARCAIEATFKTKP